MADNDKAARRVPFSISGRADIVTHTFNYTYLVNLDIELCQSITVLKLSHKSLKPNQRFKFALTRTVGQRFSISNREDCNVGYRI